MNKKISFEKDVQPNKHSEVICVKCGHRVISVRPVFVKLRKLQCSGCKETGFIIETGEVFDE